MISKDPDFTYTIYIETTLEKIWDSLTQEKLTQKYWFGIKVVSDWKVGSPIKYFLKDKVKVEGKIIDLLYLKSLSYTFHEANTESSNEPPTKVILELEPEANTKTVRLKVTHTDFICNSMHRLSVSEGWPAVLSGLKTFLETGKTLQFEV